MTSGEQSWQSRWDVPWLVQLGEEKAEWRPKSSPPIPTRKTRSQTLYGGAQQEERQ